jgi:alpha-L-fucosidase
MNFPHRHHDGLTMNHLKVSPCNIVDRTTFKRDPLKELQQACDRAGIRSCLYYSQPRTSKGP